MSGEVVGLMPSQEMNIGPVNPLFGARDMRAVVVGTTIRDLTMPAAEVNFFQEADLDKLQAENGETTLQAAAGFIVDNQNAKQGFLDYLNKNGAHLEDIDEGDVHHLLCLAYGSAEEAPGGSATNIGVALKKFNIGRAPERNDTVTIISSAGDEEYRDFFESFFKEVGIITSLQPSKPNPVSSIFPWQIEDNDEGEESLGRQIFSKKSDAPNFSEELITGKNVAAVGKLNNSEWARELVANPAIEAVLWVPGDSIGGTEKDEDDNQIPIIDTVLGVDSAIKDGSRVVVCNLGESRKVGTVVKDDSEADFQSEAEQLALMHPGVRFVITDGPNGSSYAYVNNMTGELDKLFYKNETSLPESSEQGTSTGAGDTYAAAFFEAILTGFTVDEAMQLADDAARKILCQVPATLSSWDHGEYAEAA